MPFDTSKVRLFHIVHKDRIPSLLSAGGLYSDAEVRRQGLSGTEIGYSNIKDRRFHRALDTHPDLTVGQCVPFYFCPRSPMLYTIEEGNVDPAIGGQKNIVHLGFRLDEVLTYLNSQNQNARWAFTTSNAGCKIFDDFGDLEDMAKIDWGAVNALYWKGDTMERKQAEFLVESHLPWSLVAAIGVENRGVMQEVTEMLHPTSDPKPVQMRPKWYY